MEVFIFICMCLGGYLTLKALFGSKPGGEVRYIDAPKNESEKGTFYKEGTREELKEAADIISRKYGTLYQKESIINERNS